MSTIALCRRIAGTASLRIDSLHTISLCVRGLSQNAVAGGRQVYIAGSGQVPVTRGKGIGLEQLGSTAVTAALENAKIDSSEPSGLFVGNMMSGMLSNQQHLGPLISGAAGLEGIDCATAEA